MRIGREQFLKLAHPDVPEAAGIAMVLQTERPLFIGFIHRKTDVFGGSPERRVVLYQRAVVYNGYIAGNDDPAFFIEPGAVKMMS